MSFDILYIFENFDFWNESWRDSLFAEAQSQQKLKETQKRKKRDTFLSEDL